MVYTTLWTVKRIVSSPITQAGIYHNASLGLISLSSDWENWTTIADKNLGASEVYNYGARLTNNNSWFMFQWWNNYGFLRSGAEDVSSTEVDTTWYWPWNYYSSSTFISASSDWSSPSNDNLWWDITDTLEARRWPCGNWFHIPLNQEFQNIWTMMSSFWNASRRNTACGKFLLMPNAGRLTWAGSLYNTWIWYYWTSNISSNTQWSSLYIGIHSDAGMFRWQVDVRMRWLNIRPFKNEPVQPDTSRTVLYQPS